MIRFLKTTNHYSSRSTVKVFVEAAKTKALIIIALRALWDSGAFANSLMYKAFVIGDMKWPVPAGTGPNDPESRRVKAREWTICVALGKEICDGSTRWTGRMWMEYTQYH